MSGPAQSSAPLRDEPGRRPVASRTVLHEGMVFDLVRDEVDFAPGVRFAREYLRHGGAVAILALDEQDRVLLIRQYRHPGGGTFWELPAGLLDVAGESGEDAARRELIEETSMRARSLEPLLSLHPTAGASEELIRVFAARGLTPLGAADDAPGAGFERRDEEAEIELRWVDLDEAVAAILRGDLTNATLVAAVLAQHARSR